MRQDAFFRDFLSAVERQEFDRPWLAAPGDGLDEYRTNDDFTMRDALRSVYSTLAKCLPTADFDRLARGYIAAHPPGDWDINRYGAHFPEYYAAQAGAQPRLAMIAALDRAIHFAHFALARDHLDAADLAAIPPGDHADIRLVAHEATRLIAADFPLTAVYDDPATLSSAAADGPGEQVIVSRDPAGGVHVRTLAIEQAAFVDGTIAGLTLEACLDRALDQGTDFDLPECLRRGIEAGYWSGFRI